jgi:hypothetical protein
VSYSESADQVSALPIEAFAGYLAVVGTLELVPWKGLLYNEADPDGVMRQWVFGPHGEGLVTYLIPAHSVDHNRVCWWGIS